MIEISVTSPAALASGENAPHHIVWSAWHSWVMPLSGRLYHACFCWRQWHHDRQIEEAWSFRSMYVLSKSAKWIIFFVFCLDFEAVFRHVPFTARLGNVDFWILRLRFYKEKSHWCLQWLAVWCGLLLLWKGRQEACVRRSLHALMEWPEDAGDDFPREICCGAGVPFRLFLTALNQADDAATLPKDCSSRLPLSNGLSAAWAHSASKMLKVIPGELCTSAMALSVERMWALPKRLLQCWPSSSSSSSLLFLPLLGLWSVQRDFYRRHLRCGSCIFFLWPR